MSKTAVKKLHWRSNVQDSFVPLLGSSGDLGIAAGGGADYGEFPFVTSAPGGGLTVGDIILEIGGTPVLGMTLGDVRGVLNSCPHPIRIKTVSPGFTLCKDLRLYLSKCFTPGSVDSQLQQVIRENLYLRAVPCTTRQPRDGEIPGVDYNFVSIEEFFSLEESGALLESGKFKGNYYGTPRPIHVSADSPPITYQEHRNLLRNYRTRSKSLSNLEKAAEDGPNGEEDSAEEQVGGSAGVRIRGSHRRPRASSSGDERAVENRATGGKRGARLRGLVPDRWELAFSDPGEPHFIDHNPRRTSWQSPRASSRETVYKNECELFCVLPIQTLITLFTVERPKLRKKKKMGKEKEATDTDGSLESRFTDQPGELRGFPVHAHLTKGPRGFGFNIVGGSKPGEFLQVYSVTTDGPSNLKTALALADVLVYVNEVCVLGVSHREVVEMLQVVPVGRGVDVEVKRGYPLLYTYDGCLRLPDGGDPTLLPTTTTTSQPQPRLPTPTHHSLHFDFGEVHGDGRVWRGCSRSTRHSPARATARLCRPSARTEPRGPRTWLHLTAGGPGARMTVVKRVWDRKQCQSLQPGDAIIKINGADIKSLSFTQVQTVLQEHTKQGEVILLVYRGVPHRRTAVVSLRTLLHTKALSRTTKASPTQNPSRFPEEPLKNVLPQQFHFRSRTFYDSKIKPPPRDSRYYSVDLDRGPSGFGFSLRGGSEYNMGLYVLGLMEGGPASRSQKMEVSDQLVEINGNSTAGMTHSQAVEQIRRGGHRIHLVLNRPRRAEAEQRQAEEEEEQVFNWTRDGEKPLGGGEEPPKPGIQFRYEHLCTKNNNAPSSHINLCVLRRPPPPASLLPHRFVTVRRGSPAAKSGQIRAGDRLEAVEGRSVVSLPHRELAQILRRAGNTLRLTIIPRPSTCKRAPEPPPARSGHLSTLLFLLQTRPACPSPSVTRLTGAGRVKGHERSELLLLAHCSLVSQRDSRYYSVDLDRGPSGFGFSLRGGSEYNMGLYVLGLMEGGPASRSQKMEVSDQLVEINGNSTAGMTHSQAVEQIRRGGHRIHLVLKRGNGYVPDYGE
uniref:MAGI family member, X-linked b n=1 Tax=Tetraodon nigroviridis TaxID=99883 RepID=H3D4N4_TETNG